MADERRFSGRLSEEYELLELAYPEFRSFQEQLVAFVQELPAGSDPPLRLLEIGPGHGFTTEIVLGSRNDLVIDAVDNEPAMIAKLWEQLESAVSSGTLIPVEDDALRFIQECPTHRYDGFFSAFTLHNFTEEYRAQLLPELFRVLRPGAVFLNADKYAPDGQAQFEALVTQLNRFFGAFVPLGKYELLRDWVVHNVMDQSPHRCQREGASVTQMQSLGFERVHVHGRSNMEAVLVAYTPR
jgi:SAM-dependent methyltransferase